mgnify:CR=1 FL=1
MPRLSHKALKKVGSSPGTLVHVGERKRDKVRRQWPRGEI